MTTIGTLLTFRFFGSGRHKSIRMLLFQVQIHSTPPGMVVNPNELHTLCRKGVSDPPHTSSAMTAEARGRTLRSLVLPLCEMEAVIISNL